MCLTYVVYMMLAESHDISFDNHKFAALGMVRKSSVSSLMAERKGHVDALEIGL